MQEVNQNQHEIQKRLAQVELHARAADEPNRRADLRKQQDQFAELQRMQQEQQQVEEPLSIVVVLYLQSCMSVR